MTPLSLRARLTLIILLPLLAIATLVGFWQLENARRTAADVFDRSLLSAALAVTNDVAVSGGDALSPRTQAILRDTSGGRVFYHVYAPDGVIVAGYATPPVGMPRIAADVGGPSYFEAVYLGRNVSGVRLQTRTEIDGFAGIFTTTVWQDQTVRNAFVSQLVERALATIAALIASVAMVVWFGVRLGLRPLLDLQAAIELRSSDELSAIRRPVPEEVQGIVRTLNSLFRQVSNSMTAQTEFISNAAHQLRNPIAAVLSLAEAVHAAPNAGEARRRSSDLLAAARETAELSQQLLTLERAKSLSPDAFHQPIDLVDHLEAWMPGFRDVAGRHAEVCLDAPGGVGPVLADPTMLREAIRNLIDNAQQHGGPEMSRIEITVRQEGDGIALTVADNGRGIAPEDAEMAKRRFSQLTDSSGSGLGLPIVAAIAEAHGGTMELVAQPSETAVRIHLPQQRP
ncbi:MAG: sensor histidine kinase [Pseudomonadota bacterium]